MAAYMYVEKHTHATQPKKTRKMRDKPHTHTHTYTGEYPNMAKRIEINNRLYNNRQDIIRYLLSIRDYCVDHDIFEVDGHLAKEIDALMERAGLTNTTTYYRIVQQGQPGGAMGYKFATINVKKLAKRCFENSVTEPTLVDELTKIAVGEESEDETYNGDAVLNADRLTDEEFQQLAVHEPGLYARRHGELFESDGEEFIPAITKKMKRDRSRQRREAASLERIRIEEECGVLPGRTCENKHIKDVLEWITRDIWLMHSGVKLGQPGIRAMLMEHRSNLLGNVTPLMPSNKHGFGLLHDNLSKKLDQSFNGPWMYTFNGHDLPKVFIDLLTSVASQVVAARMIENAKMLSKDFRF